MGMRMGQTARFAFVTLALIATGYAPGALATGEDLGSVIADVPVGSYPWGVAITTDNRAFVGNSGESTVSVVDLVTQRVTRTVRTGIAPAGVAITQNGFAVVANYGDDNVTRIGTSDYSVVDWPSFPLPGMCTRPLSAASNATDVIIGCQDMARVITAGTLAFGGPIGSGVTADALITRDGSPIYASGPGPWEVDWPGTSLAFGIVGDPTIASLALTPDETTLLVGLTDGRLALVSYPGGAALATITDGSGGDYRGIAVSPDGKRAYVADVANARLVVVDIPHRSLLGSIPTGPGSQPLRVAVSPDGRYAAVTNNKPVGSLIIIALPSSEAVGVDVPHAALQQYERQPSRDCSSSPPDLADFPALVASMRNVGWGASWAQWPNGGTGGFVCTRQPYYTTAGTWAVR